MSDDPHQTVTRVRDLQNQLRFLKREVKGILDTVQDIENEVDLVAGSVADHVAGSLVSCTEEDESCENRADKTPTEDAETQLVLSAVEKPAEEVPSEENASEEPSVKASSGEEE